jgi:SAM-dependent methyltransferase
MKYFKYIKYLFNYILSFFYDIYYFFFGNIRSRINNLRYYKESKKYPDYLKIGNAKKGIEFLAKKYCQGKGIDIGAGNWSFENSRPIENNKDENAFKINEKDNSLDFVFSSHTIEHLKEWQKALKEWQRVLKNKGILFLYLPHPICKMWEKGINKQHLWNPEPEIISHFLENELKMKIKDISYIPDFYSSFYIIAEKI